MPSATFGVGPTSPYDDVLATADELLRSRCRLAAQQRTGVRDSVIRSCSPWARRVAARYVSGTESSEDLGQVAVLGLILAVDRYDAGRGVAFRHFALPTVLGELRRHFRDRCWSVRVGRRTQELYQQLRRAEPYLAQRLGRTPTDADLAAELVMTDEDVRAARQAALVFGARSLNAPSSVDDGDDQLGDRLGAPDRAIEAVADHDALRRAIRVLPERLRTLLSLRYFDELTPCQIADKLGISQMQVSRQLTRALRLLREHMEADEPLSAELPASPRPRRTQPATPRPPRTQKVPR